MRKSPFFFFPSVCFSILFCFPGNKQKKKEKINDQVYLVGVGEKKKKRKKKDKTNRPGGGGRGQQTRACVHYIECKCMYIT